MDFSTPLSETKGLNHSPLNLKPKIKPQPDFGAGPVGGELWPTQLTHGSVFALEGKEGESVGWTMATAREHMTALGWRAHGSSEAFPVSKMLSALSDLCCFTPNQVKTLAGNSMHLRTQMAFMFYALGHIMLKTEHPHTLQRASTWQWEDSQ